MHLLFKVIIHLNFFDKIYLPALFLFFKRFLSIVVDINVFKQDPCTFFLPFKQKLSYFLGLDRIYGKKKPDYPAYPAGHAGYPALSKKNKIRPNSIFFPVNYIYLLYLQVHHEGSKVPPIHE